MTRRVVLTLLVLAGLTALGWRFYRSLGPAPVPTLVGAATIAASASLTGVLIWAAADKGFFEQKGVQITVKSADSGKSAMEAVTAGQADFASTAEYALLKMTVKHPDLRIVATISTSHDISVVATSESAIASPADLVGKRVGITMGTSVEFFLDRLLALSGRSNGMVQQTHLPPLELTEALAAGKIDAAIAWQPHVQAMIDRLGGKAVVFDAQADQDYYFVLIGREAWLRSQRETTKRVLRALQMAEAWADRHPDEFLTYVKSKGFCTPNATAAVLAPHRFRVSLPSSLVAVLADERAWLSKKGSVGELPTDMLDLIEPGPLKDVAPTAVTVVQ